MLVCARLCGRSEQPAAPPIAPRTPGSVETHVKNAARTDETTFNQDCAEIWLGDHIYPFHVITLLLCTNTAKPSHLSSLRNVGALLNSNIIRLGAGSAKYLIVQTAVTPPNFDFDKNPTRSGVGSTVGSVFEVKYISTISSKPGQGMHNTALVVKR